MGKPDDSIEGSYTELDATKLSEWLHQLCKNGGKGVVNNIDARALGRCGDEIDRLKEQNAALLSALDRLQMELRAIMNESEGVDGYHLNGDIATWSEIFPEHDGEALHQADAAIAAARGKP